jgi:hypothetical protein
MVGCVAILGNQLLGIDGPLGLPIPATSPNRAMIAMMTAMIQSITIAIVSSQISAKFSPDLFSDGRKLSFREDAAGDRMDVNED